MPRAIAAFPGSILPKFVAATEPSAPQPGEVLWMILKHALLLVTAGILGGLVGSSIIAHSLSNLLFNVSPTDPVTFLAITLIFLLTAAISGLIPAFRAAKIDPAITLRAD